ncbi:hypothetical protein AB0953_16735 [Streptomyces sp. NPDC046866]|uniref:hypothetical protein n=1 Tax=Streptomyces sp. NPDC046866 TaxID=3154921 RepID=UPI003454A9E0
MTASETVFACLAVAVGLLVVATHGWDAWHRPRTRRRFQRTARQAARTRADVLRDLAAAKTERARIQAAADLADCIAIWDATPHDIPHQRSKEDPQ